tara:strand:- start:228 stop:428 length:201 start_codon:yes stop_codon:yes gene_type:complete
MKVEIKNEWVDKLKERVESTSEFENVEEYVNYILEQIVGRLKEEAEEQDNSDDEEISEKLRDLGYT